MQLLETTLGQTLELWAHKTPDTDFIVYPDRDLHFSYRQFNQRVNNLAKGFIYLGVESGDKVAIWAKNIPDWTTVMFAAAKIGAVLVPINTNYKKPEIEFLLKNAEVNTLCFAEGFKSNEFCEIINELIPEIKESKRGALKSTVFPRLKNLVFLGHSKQKGMFTIPELILLGSHIDDIELESAGENNHYNSTTLLLYTAGTTGQPKGAMLSHYNIINNGFSVGECMKYTQNDKILLCVPLYNSFGSVLGVCSAVTHGATLVINEEFNPSTVLRSVEKEACTALYGVPTMFIEELEVQKKEKYNLNSLRTGIMSGAPCPIDVMKKVMSDLNMREIIIVYGLTEASPGITATRTHNTALARASTIGFELPNVKVKIVDPETGIECSENNTGEICCKGYNVFQGYYKNPDETANVIDSEGWLHTGDLAFKNANGFYQFAGRITETIIKGGENIYPSEIEDMILQIEGINRVAVLGVKDEKYGEEICAVIQRIKNNTPTKKSVIEFCKKNMARFKVPRYVYFLDELPISANNKVQKFKLQQMVADLIKTN